jgi:hypothetical protein
VNLAPLQDGFVDPLKPAAEQFGGQGSCGNGAAMRVHPVALFCHGLSEERLMEVAKRSSIVTHSHKVMLGTNSDLIKIICIVEPGEKPKPIGFPYPENRPAVGFFKCRFRFSSLNVFSF